MSFRKLYSCILPGSMLCKTAECGPRLAQHAHNLYITISDARWIVLYIHSNCLSICQVTDLVKPSM